MVLKIETQGKAPQRRPNMEPRGMLTTRICLKNTQVRELTTPSNFIAMRLVHTLRGEERGRKIPRVMALKSLRKPNHPIVKIKNLVIYNVER
jgi:hypothetical protein